MRKTHKLLIVALTALALAACAGDKTPSSNQPGSSANPATSSNDGASSSHGSTVRIVEDIRIKTLPKTVYVLGEEFSIETALVVCEIYRSGNDWKFNAVGAGYQGGLYALCKNYGVNV